MHQNLLNRYYSSEHFINPEKVFQNAHLVEMQSLVLNNYAFQGNAGSSLWKHPYKQ